MKIADFGLARELTDKDYYRKRTSVRSTTTIVVNVVFPKQFLLLDFLLL